MVQRSGGRPRKMSKEQVSMALRLYFGEKMPIREVADAMRVSHMTVWRVVSRASLQDIMDKLERNEPHCKAWAIDLS
ncbi:MAG: helix-turn-helix domain-containing protein [Candidatus Micrarchaeota archaeon]|nr:helix-turn-helix domain-containing protein [Candidatus Micrarchaeota archaeon]